MQYCDKTCFPSSWHARCTSPIAPPPLILLLITCHVTALSLSFNKVNLYPRCCGIFLSPQWHQYFWRYCNVSYKLECGDNANNSHSLFFLPHCLLFFTFFILHFHLFLPLLIYSAFFALFFIDFFFFWMSLIISLFILVSVVQFCVCCMCFVRWVVWLSGGGSTYL